MRLFDEIARALGLEIADQKSEITALKKQLAEMQGRLEDYGQRIARVEHTIQDLISGFGVKLKELAVRGRQASRQTTEELSDLQRDLDLFIDILDKSIAAQFDMVRRQEIRKLLRA